MWSMVSTIFCLWVIRQSGVILQKIYKYTFFRISNDRRRLCLALFGCCFFLLGYCFFQLLCWFFLLCSFPFLFGCFPFLFSCCFLFFFFCYNSIVNFIKSKCLSIKFRPNFTLIHLTISMLPILLKNLVK